MLTAFFARFLGLGRLLTPRAWLILAALIAVLLIALWIYNAGGKAVRVDVAIEAAQVEVKAGKGRETAATERTVDTGANAARLEEWNHAAEQTPDASPDDRELQRRCRQLRDAGRDVSQLAQCRGS
jgi:hypothetical protein